MPTPSAPPDAAVARFKADLVRLIGEPAAPLLIAVSGGADSVAMLLLANTAFPSLCRAATVDHGLRAEAEVEAESVAKLCAQLGIAHAVLRGALPERVARTANLSSRARALRYELLNAHAEAIGADHILTAHHADDQVETLVMRLNRGTGLTGMAGIPSQSGRVVRPVLSWRHDELTAVVQSCGIKAVHDPSNDDVRFERARVRKALAGTPLLEAPGIVRTVAALRQAEEAIEWMTSELWSERARTGAEGLTVRTNGLPLEVRRRFVRRCLTQIQADTNPRGAQVERLIGLLQSGREATLCGVACRAKGDLWHFSLAPPRRR